MNRSIRRILVLSFLALALGSPGFSQSLNQREGIKLIEGEETVRGYRLSPDARSVLDPSGQVLIRLPAVKGKAVPELMGMLQQGPDIELFLRRPDDPAPSGFTRYRLNRLENKSFRLVAQASLPPEPIAFLVDTRDSLSGKKILVRAATPAECKAPGAAYREETGTVKAYVLRGDKLQEVQP